MKIKEYIYTVEGDNLVFRPEFENDTKPADEISLTAYRILNTYKINLKLWDAMMDCVFERLAVDNADFEDKMMKEIESLKAEIKMLKGRSVN